MGKGALPLRPFRDKKYPRKDVCNTSFRGLSFGAADEARTRYLHLGKVALYQMSYGRIKKSPKTVR